MTAEQDWVGMTNVMIAYYLHLDASQMDDREWCKTVAYLEYIRKKEAGKNE